jgi:hypothetical protein
VIEKKKPFMEVDEVDLVTHDFQGGVRQEVFPGDPFETARRAFFEKHGPPV